MKHKTYFVIYFEKTGFSKTWFAERIGISKTFFYQILNGRYPLPKKYWRAIIQESSGKITLAHLIYDYLDDEDLFDVDYLRKDKCTVSLKKVNKETLNEEILKN